MQRWEYRFLTIITDLDDSGVCAYVAQQMNELGAQGWQYVATPQPGCFLMQRPRGEVETKPARAPVAQLATDLAAYTKGRSAHGE